MSDWLNACEGIVATAIPVVGLVYTYTGNRRSQYERVLSLTGESGASPIADDRHLIGTTFEPTSKLPAGEPVPLGESEVKALFSVLWYFNRADALYVSLRPLLWPSRITRAQALLLDSLAAAVNTWSGYVSLTWADSAGRSINATGATGGLRHLATEHARLSARRARSGLRLPQRRAEEIRPAAGGFPCWPRHCGRQASTATTGSCRPRRACT
jgi:hypothetical protein